MDFHEPIALADPLERQSLQARVIWGNRIVTVGGGAPVRIQSMTNTDTVDAIGTAIQVKELALAGSEMVRITVNTPEAAQAVPYIRDQLDRMGIDVPLIGDFHFNGHRLLQDFPECAQALSKYQRVETIAQMVEETSTTIRGTAETANQLELIAQGLKAQIGRFRV